MVCPLSARNRVMLSALTKAFRVKAAVALAALYVLCALAPAAAFAFSPNPAVAHCLIEGHIGVHDQRGEVHVHANGTTHQHRDDGTAHHQDRHDGAAPQHSSDGEKAPVATCCGLFSIVAIADTLGSNVELYSTASMVAPVPGEALSGRGPERINRPPIA